MRFEENTMLFGSDATPRIVAIEMGDTGTVKVYRREKDGSTACDIEPFHPFFWRIAMSRISGSTSLCRRATSCPPRVESSAAIVRKGYWISTMRFVKDRDRFANYIQRAFPVIEAKHRRRDRHLRKGCVSECAQDSRRRGRA